MRELLLVGRGGEGVVLASQILADTFARAGYWVQGFPEFKAERRGAPISAFVRWDESEPIHRRYKFHDCDVLAVVSPSPPASALLGSVRPGGLLVLNRESRFRATGAFAVVRVPASRIASDHGVLSSEGRPMGNVAVLGACVRQLLPEGLPLLEEAIRLRLPEASVLAARDGYARCTRQHARLRDPVIVRAAAPGAPPRVRPLFPVSTTDSRSLQTGNWSLERPVILDACNACALCALFCPEGAITRDGRAMAVDYFHCKGCGICAEVCPVRNAIELEAVPA